MWQITLRDLQFRRRRFVLAVIGAAFVFAMALVMSGLASGFRAEARKIVELVGADAWVVASSASGPFTATATLPGFLADKGVLGVASADPIVILRQSGVPASKPRKDINVIGHRLGGLGSPQVRSGRAVTASGEVVVDRLLELRLGTRIDIGGRSFRVVGITSGASYNVGIPTAFISVGDAQAIAFGGQSFVTAIVTRGVPSSLPQGAHVVTPEATRADLIRPLENGIASIDNSRLLLWVVAAFIIAVVVYLSALERTRDFAVLKAVGASSRSLFAGLALQSVLLAVAGAVLATGISRLLVPAFPLPVEIPVSAIATLPVVAAVVGLIACTAGVRRAVSVDPALAFGGP